MFWYRFRGPLGPILEPTWPQLGLQNRFKIDPRAIKNPFKISSCIWYPLGSIFDGFWLQLGTLEPSKNIEKQLVFQCFCDFCWLPLGWLLEANLAPFWEGLGSQVGAKLAPNCSKNRSKNLSKKWSHVALIFCRILFEFGANLAPNIGRKMFVMLVYVGSWSHLGAKMAPGPPQEAPKPPLGPILEPTWHQLGLQNRPKSTQIAICIWSRMHVYMHASWLPHPAIPRHGGG